VNKLLRLLLATLLFLLLLALVYVVHSRFFPVRVVLYSALFDVLLAALLCGASRA